METPERKTADSVISHGGTKMVPDTKLLADAREAVGFASMLMDNMTREPNRDQIDIAQRAVSLANAKLVEYQCQLRNAPRKET